MAGPHNGWCFAAMPEQQLVSKKGIEQAKALYEYTAANNEEIDLAAGDTVTIEFKVSSPPSACLHDCSSHDCLLARTYHAYMTGGQRLVDWDQRPDGCAGIVSWRLCRSAQGIEAHASLWNFKRTAAAGNWQPPNNQGWRQSPWVSI